MPTPDAEIEIERHQEVPGLSPVAKYAYAQAISAGAFVFLAGQAGLDETGQLVSLEFEQQARRTFANIERALQHVGSTLSDIVTMTVFITDWRYGPDLVRVRQDVLGDDLIPSALIGVSQLADPAMLVEIQCTAVRRGK